LSLASGGFYRHLKLSQTGATRLEVISDTTGAALRIYDSTATIGVNLLSVTSASPSWLALNGNFGIGTTTATEKLTLDGRQFLSNQTAPGTPTAGGIIYVESGALKYIGSSGTITTLGVA